MNQPLPKAANNPAATRNRIDIDMDKTFSQEQAYSLLAKVQVLYEKSRVVRQLENGQFVASCSAEDWHACYVEICYFVAEVAKVMLGIASPKIAEIAYESGFKYGLDCAKRTPGRRLLNSDCGAPAPVDSEVLAAIAEQLRQMFDSGFEHGKVDRAAPPRVVSAVNKVERSPSGDITQAVTTYEYEDTPGVQPPPL